MPLHVHISGDYYVTSDRHGYQLALYKGQDKKGNPVWESLKFSGTLAGILEAWSEQKIRESSAQSFDDLNQTLKEVRDELRQIRRRLGVSSADTSSGG